MNGLLMQILHEPTWSSTTSCLNIWLTDWCIEDQTVRCRTTVRCEVLKMKSAYELQTGNKLRDISGAVGPTPNAWSYRVYREYFDVGNHLIFWDRHLRIVLSDFTRFLTSPNSTTASRVLVNLIVNFGISCKLRAVGTNSTSDISAGMELLTRILGQGKMRRKLWKMYIPVALPMFLAREWRIALIYFTTMLQQKALVCRPQRVPPSFEIRTSWYNHNLGLQCHHRHWMWMLDCHLRSKLLTTPIDPIPN